MIQDNRERYLSQAMPPLQPWTMTRVFAYSSTFAFFSNTLASIRLLRSLFIISVKILWRAACGTVFNGCGWQRWGCCSISWRLNSLFSRRKFHVPRIIFIFVELSIKCGATVTIPPDAAGSHWFTISQPSYHICLFCRFTFTPTSTLDIHSPSSI